MKINEIKIDLGGQAEKGICKAVKINRKEIDRHRDTEPQRVLWIPPPPVFSQKSVQGVEKKGWALPKERQERGKSLQEYENNEFTTEVTESTEKGEC